MKNFFTYFKKQALVVLAFGILGSTNMLVAQCGPGETAFSETINFTNPNLSGGTNFFDFTGFPAGTVVSAQITIRGFGDLDGTGGNIERWDVVGETTPTVLGSVGASGNFGDQCNTTFNSGVIVLDPVEVNDWASDGTVSLEGWDAELLQGTGPGNINVTLCGGDFLEVTLEMCIGSGGGGGPGGDCNATDCVDIVCPADVTVACFEDVDLDPSLAISSSTCGSITTTYVTQPDITGAANCPGTTYIVSYRAVDSDGNKGCCDRIITIENAAPTVEVIPGLTVGCYEDIETLLEDATVSTSCGEDYELKILPPVLEGIHECPGTTYTYTYRVRDNCGREVTADRVFTIGNNATPTIVAPPDMVVSCDWNFNLNPDYATVTTGCTLGYTTTVSGPTTSGAANCPGSTYTYTYTVTDDCGRTASDVRTFTIDNEGPVFLNCPDVPLQLNCEDEGWENIIQAWLASVKAESTCSDVLSVTNNYNPNTQGLCINNGTKVVRFFATDACGRTSMCEGMIIIADTEAPIFTTAPEDALVVCNYVTQDKLDAWVDANAFAEVDDCWDNVNWSTFPNNPTINCDPTMPTSITVTFVATDGCGNKASMDATFTALPAMNGAGGSNEDVAAEDHLQLFQNQPNPFEDETSISFYIPKAGKATLSIFDVSGKLLKEIKGDYNQGMNVEEINRSEMQGAGLLYYKLSTDTETATRRMILLD